VGARSRACDRRGDLALLLFKRGEPCTLLADKWMGVRIARQQSSNCSRAASIRSGRSLATWAALAEPNAKAATAASLSEETALRVDAISFSTCASWRPTLSPASFASCRCIV